MKRQIYSSKNFNENAEFIDYEINDGEGYIQTYKDYEREYNSDPSLKQDFASVDEYIQSMLDEGVIKVFNDVSDEEYNHYFPIQSSSDASEEWISEEDREFAESEDFDLTGDDMEDFWNKYLIDAENPVLEELEVATEPSGQGSLATMYLVDDSGQERFDSIGIDWWEWSDNEISMALDSNNAAEYADKFKAYVKEVCGL